jgi:hypothetical protein
MPPTAVTLAQLRACTGLSQALTARPVTPLMPEVTVDGDSVWLTLPEGQEYPL